MTETSVRVEAIRIPHVRETPGALQPLADSITSDGLHRPVTVWRDGTVVSGARRVRSHFLMGQDTIQAVFVNTIEDAAKRLIGDMEDDTCSVRMKWSEVCRLWHLLRKLDEPAAVKRAEAARRRGVELRKLTQAGKRAPGRSGRTSDDYVLGVLCEPFGISVHTARRVEIVWQTANGVIPADDDKRVEASQIMAGIDSGESIWAGHQKLMGLTVRVRTERPRPVVPTEPAPAARQVQAWERSLPQLEGLVAGLVELGPPNPDLTWSQVGPVHTRLALVRRTIERIARQMKETSE